MNLRHLVPTRNWLVLTTCSALAILALLWVAAVARFGTVSAALNYLSGQRLIVDENRRSFGTLEAGRERTVEFMVTNDTSKPVSLLGARVSCTCVSVEDLPRTLAPSARWPLRVTIRAGRRERDVSEGLWLYTDAENRPQIALQLTGRMSGVDPDQATGLDVARSKEP
jgi:hypothetical protein